MPLNQIAADRRQAGERADSGIVAPGRGARTVIAQEAGPGVLSGTGEDGVGMSGGLLGE